LIYALEKSGQGIEVGAEKDAKVAGGKWRFEEATPITTCAPANPTDPGDAADPSTPQGILSSSPNTHYDTHGLGRAFFKGACFAPPDIIMPGAAS
jgi:hypothetical protein